MPYSEPLHVNINAAPSPHDTIAGSIRFEVRDKNGVIRKDWVQPMRSFNDNFLSVMNYAFWPALIDGTSVTIVNRQGTLVATADRGITAHAIVNGLRGIAVGRSGDPFDFDSVNLDYIEYGDGEGELHAGATLSSSFNITRAEGKVDFSREFTNLSGSPVTVRETGIVANANTLFSALNIVRDVLEPEITLANNETLLIHYFIGFPGRFTNTESGLLSVMSGSTAPCLSLGGLNRNMSVSNPRSQRDVQQAALQNVTGLFYSSSDAPLEPNGHEFPGHILHGSGENQLIYLATMATHIITEGTEHYFLLRRSAVNQSGNPITIRQLGVVGGESPTTGLTQEGQMLVDRVLLPEPVTVAPGLVLNSSWKYKISD